MKVLMISFDRHLSSPESDVAMRMREIGSVFDELHIIVFSLERHRLQETELAPNVHMHPTNARWKLGYFTRALALARGLRDRVDLVITQDPHDTGLVGYIAARMIKAPLCVQEHGDYYSAPHWRRESALNRLRYYLGLFVLRRAQQVRVVSCRIRDALIGYGVPAERIQTFPVRTATRALRDAEPQFDLHERYPDAGVIVLTLARLVPQKDLGLLIDAFAGVLERHPDALLLIVGDGPEKERLARRAGERDSIKRIVFEPWADDIASYYKGADIYALSSKYEGWGRVLIEAMTCGLPAVTTDVGLVDEVFKDGEHGRVVPVGDARAFANALIELIEDPSLRTEMGARAAAAIDALPEVSYAQQYRELTHDVA